MDNNTILVIDDDIQLTSTTSPVTGEFTSETAFTEGAFSVLASTAGMVCWRFLITTLMVGTQSLI